MQAEGRAALSRSSEAIVLAACLALAISALASNAVVVADSLAATFSAVDFLAPVLALAIHLLQNSAHTNAHIKRDCACAHRLQAR